MWADTQGFLKGSTATPLACPAGRDGGSASLVNLHGLRHGTLCHFWLEPKTSQSTATRCHSVLRLHQNSASCLLATEFSALLTPTLFPSWSLTSPREPPASPRPRAVCRCVLGSGSGCPSPLSEGPSLVSPPTRLPRILPGFQTLRHPGSPATSAKDSVPFPFAARLSAD